MSIIPPRSHWPAVPASLISHYCVTAVASLNTPSVMYGLTLPGIQKPQRQSRGTGSASERLQYHLVGKAGNYTCFYPLTQIFIEI